MISEVEFKIYTKSKKFQWTANLLVYSFLFGCLGFEYVMDSYFNESNLKGVGHAGALLGLVLSLYLSITSAYRRKPLHGDLNKQLRFTPSAIYLADQCFELEQIKKIEFLIIDHYDKVELSSRGNLNPGKTNGTANVCELILHNGQNIKANFQLMYDGQFLKMKELLIHYHLENKIHFLKLIEYLGIDDYSEIQAFKKTLPSKPIK